MNPDTDTGTGTGYASALAARRKRLRFRCWRRGSREADLLLGRFADAHLDRLEAPQLARLERLLECDDPDIWDWTVRGAAPPAELDTDVLALLRRRVAGRAP